MKRANEEEDHSSGLCCAEEKNILASPMFPKLRDNVPPSIIIEDDSISPPRIPTHPIYPNLTPIPTNQRTLLNWVGYPPKSISPHPPCITSPESVRPEYNLSLPLFLFLIPQEDQPQGGSR
ncbi:hypothetical protein Droror1_Dr00013719 [Drosera rotundifolia]